MWDISESWLRVWWIQHKAERLHCFHLFYLSFSPLDFFQCQCFASQRVKWRMTNDVEAENQWLWTGFIQQTKHEHIRYTEEEGRQANQTLDEFTTLSGFLLFLNVAHCNAFRWGSPHEANKDALIDSISFRLFLRQSCCIQRERSTLFGLFSFSITSLKVQTLILWAFKIKF